MRDDDPRECSEEQLSGLLDDELDVADKRAAALHAATCPHCAQALGQLFATRAALSVPVPRRVAVPRTFWRGVRERLDQMDGVIRATNLSAERRRPLLSPALLAGCVAVVALAFCTKAFLAPRRPMSDELARLHLAASLGSGATGLHPIGFTYRVANPWQEVSSEVVNMNGVEMLRTTYDVNGLPVSVFRVPSGMLDTRQLVSVRVGDQMLYVASSCNNSLAAIAHDGGWYVVVARSPSWKDTVGLALTCPRNYQVTTPY